MKKQTCLNNKESYNKYKIGRYILLANDLQNKIKAENQWIIKIKKVKFYLKTGKNFLT